MSDREALIDAFSEVSFSDWPEVQSFVEGRVADAILSSDWLAAHDAEKRAEWEAEQGETKALTEKDLYELPSLSMVLRSWPNSPGPDMPEVYQKRGGWWLELTDRNDDYGQSTGVIWSEYARFTLIHAPVPDTTNNESEDEK